MGGERRYRLVGRLADSGYGPVYEARDEASGATVAVRLLRPRFATADTIGLFQDIARKHAIIGDRAIVPIAGVVEMSGHWIVPTELVAASSLREQIAVRPYPTNLAAAVVGQVARALQLAYDTEDPATGEPLRLLHRSLRPESILITVDGTVRLLGFGLPGPTGPAEGGGYIAPERVAGEDTPATDIYALGIILREMLTGRRPVVANEPAAVPVQPDESEEVDEAATEIVDGVTREVVGLAISMCEPNPEQRPTAQQVADICEAVSSRGPNLRQYVAGMPGPPRSRPDERVGMRLSTGDDETTEDTTPQVAPPRQVGSESPTPAFPTGRSHTPPPSRRTSHRSKEEMRRTLALAGGGLAAAIVLLLSFVVVVLALYRFGGGGPIAPATPSAPQVPVAADPAPSPQPTPEAGEDEPLPDEDEPSPDDEPSPQADEPPAADPEPVGQPEAEARSEPAAPPPADPPRAETSSISLAGSGSVALRRGGSDVKVPGDVAAGTYEIVVTFDGEAPFVTGQLVIEPGKAYTIDCKPMMGRCFVR